MSQPCPSLYFAHKYHWALPPRIRGYLHDRGLPDTILEEHLVGWSGSWITLPIFDRKGDLVFFRLARDPQASGPKTMSPKGATAELYGWEHLKRTPQRIIICEGEFDRLVLEARGISAVTATGGAGTFKPEWADAFEGISEVYLCFDRDEAGRKGAHRVAGFLPGARFVELPEAVGPGGDVTDFFVRLGRSRQEFSRLLKEARPIEGQGPEGKAKQGRGPGPDPEIVRLKAAYPLETLVAQYLTLCRSGDRLLALCPFHKECHPSFVVYPATQTFHCFGCGAHGDAIEFLQRMEHLSFPEALEMLRRLAPTP